MVYGAIGAPLGLKVYEPHYFVDSDEYQSVVSYCRISSSSTTIPSSSRRAFSRTFLMRRVHFGLDVGFRISGDLIIRFDIRRHHDGWQLSGRRCSRTPSECQHQHLSGRRCSRTSPDWSFLSAFSFPHFLKPFQGRFQGLRHGVWRDGFLPFPCRLHPGLWRDIFLPFLCRLDPGLWRD